MTNLEIFFADAKREFGLSKDHEDFEQITSLPEGFESSCWHNSACPSLNLSDNKEAETADGDYIICAIYIGSKNPELREYDPENQFNIQIDGGGVGYNYAYVSNSWDDIIAHASKAREILRALIETANAKDMKTAFQENKEMAEAAGFTFVE